MFPPAEKLQNFFGVFLQFQIGVDRQTNQKDKAVERGVKMLLRAKIIDLGLHYLEVGEIPPYGMETLKGCYKEYEALGDGDHSVGDIVRRCETLKIRNG